MKINYLFLLILLFACNTTSTNQDSTKPAKDFVTETEIPDFSGYWKWNENQEGQHIFELVLEQQGATVKGYICAIAETADGQRIGCAYGDGYAKHNLTGTIKENVLTADITGAFSKQSGKIMLIHNQDQLRWTMLETPGNDYLEDYFFPNEAVLLPDDRSELREVPYRKAYVWEVASPGDKTAGFSGKWMLSDFLDSTLLQKKVMPLIAYPANRYIRFLTLLDFSTPSDGQLRIASAMDDNQVRLVKTKDGPPLFELEPYFYQLETMPGAEQLKLTVYQKNLQKPLAAYIYVPAPEKLAAFDEDAMALHFNQILAGKYQIVKGQNEGSEVIFGAEKNLSGLGYYDTYRVHWKAEPGTPEVDAVHLFDSANNEARYFHFRFEGKTLFLYNLKKTADPESGFFEYTIAEEIFQLKKSE